MSALELLTILIVAGGAIAAIAIYNLARIANAATRIADQMATDREASFTYTASREDHPHAG